MPSAFQPGLMVHVSGFRGRVNDPLSPELVTSVAAFLPSGTEPVVRPMGEASASKEYEAFVLRTGGDLGGVSWGAPSGMIR